jgi:hypothetical protein
MSADMKTHLLSPSLALCAHLLLAGGSSAAEPAEAPILTATGTLSYQVEMTGSGGAPIVHRISVLTPVSSSGSGPQNVLGAAFTDSQQREVDAMSAATIGQGGDGVAAILDLNAALEAMIEACAPPGSSACPAARVRVEHANAVIEDHGAQIADAQGRIVHDDSDDHRFLTFVSGERGQGCGRVEASYQQGGRTGSASLAPSDMATCQTMVVVDRRTGELALTMSPASLLADGQRIVELTYLKEAPDLRIGGLMISVSLPPQPTAGADRDYAGSKTVEAGGRTFKFSWTLHVD